MNDTQKIETELHETEQKIRDLRKKLHAAEKVDRIERQRPLRPVAQKAHALLCAYNHTDGCAWSYEENRKNPDAAWEADAEYSSHRAWLGRVEKVCKTFDVTPPQVMELLDIFEQVKKINPRALYLFNSLRG